MITMGSLFSGIGGFEVAANWHGIKCLWQSEVEPWAVELLNARFPDVRQLGDVCDINGADIPPVDIVTFGSPCQDMSIAGAREGLNGSQSRLFYEAIRIIREMRENTNGKYPSFAVWENVPGAFTSNKGMDFRTVLEEITETKIPMPASGRWANAGVVRGGIADVAWRVMDAQYWGVPQRRKRIYLVADYRGQRAGEILFKPEGVSRCPAPCGETWKSIAADIEGSFGETSGGIKAAGFLYKSSAKARSIGYADELAPTLRAEQTPAVIVLQDKIIGRKDKNTCNGDGISEGVCYTLTSTDVHGVCVPVVYDARGNGDGEISPTITGDHNSRVTDYTAVLCEPITYNGATVTPPANKQNPQHGDPCHTLSTDSRNYVVVPVKMQKGSADSPLLMMPFAVDCRNMAISENISGTLQAKENGGHSLNYQNPVVVPIIPINTQIATRDNKLGEGTGLGIGKEGDPSFTLLANHSHAVAVPVIEKDIIYIVRRLTPSECAKVQGFPADWHKGIVNSKGKKMPDTATYRGYGNAVATVCAEYPIQGIYEILSKEEEQK